VRAALHPAGLYLMVRDIASDVLDDAFLFETIARLPAAERVVQIPPELIGKDSRAAAPAGLVFHVGRSGSTLISQLLKKADDLVVYAEPQAFNELLLPPHRAPRAQLVAALRSLGGAFAAHAGKPYVLKFSSWNTLLCDLLVEAFPETPWVFNVRDPLEVGVSLMRTAPGWFGDDEASRTLARLVDPAGVMVPREDYIARVFAAFCGSIARLDPARGEIVAYDALPAAVWENVAPHFGLSLGDAARARMSDAAGRNAKAKMGDASSFVPDSVGKRAEASEALRTAIDAIARPEYERLLAR